MVDPALAVRPFIAGLDRPISMAFLRDGSAFVLEKSSGKVQHVRDGAATTVLDLAVNSNSPQASERGLLGIALHPRFPANPGVYLYWSESIDPTRDTLDPSESPVLGNRVDRFVWDGTSLVMDRNLIRMRARRDDDVTQKAGHIGGVLRFGPDGKLYVVIGDVGRRGQLQNLPCGPTLTCPGPLVADDAHGNRGPRPDDEHLTGVVLRLNPDGSTPTDNPFYRYGRRVGGEEGENLQKVYAYGVRNTFGIAFDPVSGALWDQENGEDGYDEINRVDPGFNSGWVQVMGPKERYLDWRDIETVQAPGGAGETRYPTSNMAATFEEARARFFKLPGSRYSDPEFSWRYPLSPAGIGFIAGRGLGPEYRNDLVVGSTRDGVLLRFELNAQRQRIVSADPLLADRVADNSLTVRTAESESLVFGNGFGIVSDVQAGPNGNLFVIDHISGNIFEIYRVPVA